MIRQHLFHKKTTADPMFRWRGGDVSRLEGLADGVFALTLTLLVIRSDVPETFHELIDSAKQVPVFLACFALLMLAWRYHYLFFRRYGLEDFPTSFLNAVYLFLVIFLAFPLKFIATFLYALVLGDYPHAMFGERQDLYSENEQICGMMQFYAIAMIGVFGVQILMLLWAWRRRHDLELDRLEHFLTLSSIRAHGITCGIAGLSLLIVTVWDHAGWAGVVYFLMPVAHGGHGFWSGSRAGRIRDELEITGAA